LKYNYLILQDFLRPSNLFFVSYKYTHKASPFAILNNEKELAMCDLPNRVRAKDTRVRQVAI